MENVQVKSLCETARVSLRQAAATLEQFLNANTLDGLSEGTDDDSKAFNRDFISDMRHLLVFCEVHDEKLGIVLRRPNFAAEQAGKVLYDVYHQCINRFYFPKNECYSEDGRYAYTGQDAIRFRKKPSRTVRDITLDMSRLFEPLREQLAYYENDYMNDLRMQGERV